ncbi:MAG: hypothetical protein ACE5IQ_00265 [Candidatus Methylomirabilales bacterium]
MFDRRYDPMFLRGIFEQTRVLRRPISNIVVGYHVLPYILVGPDVEMERRAVEVRGKIRVSPRLVIRPESGGQTYGEVFGESEIMDRTLVGRLFAFRYAARRHAVLESEELTIRPAEGDPEARIERILDELARGEILDTGLILSPDVKFYPVSIDRFLHEILDRELGE